MWCLPGHLQDACHQVVEGSDRAATRGADKVKTNLVLRRREMTRSAFCDFFLQYFDEKFLMHSYIVRHQRQVFEAVLEKLPLDQVVLLMDYAMNYSHKSREAAQGEHFSPLGTTLFIVVAFRKLPVGGDHKLVQESHIFVSPDKKHDNPMVRLCTRAVIQWYRKIVRPFRHVRLVSDNCCSQLKCCEHLGHLNDIGREFGLTMSHLYSGEGHGKEQCDAEGGSAKSTLNREVLHGELVPDAFTACTLLNSKKMKLPQAVTGVLKELDLLNERGVIAWSEVVRALDYEGGERLIEALNTYSEEDGPVRLRHYFYIAGDTVQRDSAKYSTLKGSSAQYIYYALGETEWAERGGNGTRAKGDLIMAQRGCACDKCIDLRPKECTRKDWIKYIESIEAMPDGPDKLVWIERLSAGMDRDKYRLTRVPKVGRK